MADQLLSDLASLRIDRSGKSGVAEHGPPGPSGLGPPPVGGSRYADAGPGRGGSLVRALLWTAGGALLLAAGYLWGYPALASRVWKAQVSLTEVAVLTPTGSGVQVELSATGYVVPQTMSKVGAKVQGRVAEVRVQQGQKVQIGDVLLRLDEVEARALLAASRARALAAVARVQTARANLAEAQLQAGRARGLADKDVGPAAQASDLEARVTSLSALLKAAEAEAQAAQAEVETQKTALLQLTVTAPITGTVLSKPPEVGEVVGPLSSASAQSGTTGLFELADLSRASLVVETDVPEGRLSRVKIGGPAEIVLDAYPQKRLRGRTLSILPRVSRAKATVPVRVEFTDEEALAGVLPDMAARIHFLSKPLSDAALREAPKIVLPASALTERDGQKGVFVYERESETIRFTQVTLGPALSSETTGGSAGSFELVAGPPPGSKLVRRPDPALRSGQKVKESERNEP